MTKQFSDSIILFGGSSEERLVSVASAQNLSTQIPEAALWFLSKKGEIHEIKAPELAGHKNPFTQEFMPSGKARFSSIKEAIPELKNKAIIIALHGTEGEDGTLQKILEEGKVTYTGTNSKASALCFDKVQTKKMARSGGLPVVAELTVMNFTAPEVQTLEKFFQEHKKIVLKPAANGSSVGLFIVSNEAELKNAVKTIQEKKLNHYLAEPFITGREITVGVREKASGEVNALPCSEVRVIQGRQFDYEGKYLGSGVEELTPAPITPEETQKCQELAIKLHKLMGCRGYTRTDMILTQNGPILLEINTLPGLSKASFVPQQLQVLGESMRDFFQEQINLK